MQGAHSISVLKAAHHSTQSVCAVHKVAMSMRGVGGTSLTTAGFRAALQQRSFASNIWWAAWMLHHAYIQVTRAILCPGDGCDGGVALSISKAEVWSAAVPLFITIKVVYST
jgi:hypothetical protein